MYFFINTGKCRFKLLLILLSILISKCYSHDCTFQQIGSTDCTLYVKCQSNLIRNMYSIFYDQWVCFQNFINTRYNSYRYHNVPSYSFKIYISIAEVYTAPDWTTLGEMLPYVKSIEIKNGTLEQPVTSSLPNIKNLTVVHNNIASLSLNNILNLCPLLQQIDLSYNSISALDTSNGGQKCNLEHIDFSNNLITKIPDMHFVKCSDLHYLDLSHNLMTSFNILTFEGIYNLITLKLSNNKIFDIGLHFQRFLSLQHLYLDSNELKSLTNQSFSSLSKLEFLNISNNVIRHLDSTIFYDMKELNVLDLSFNNIKKIPSTLFKNNKNLQTLDLKHNNIEIIEQGAFMNTTLVTSLGLEGNFLQGFIDKKVFAGILSLDKLDLSGQKITGIGSEFVNGHNISCLSFTSNLITNISATAFRLVPDLKILDLSHNFITVLEFNVELPNLSMLYLKNNSLKYLKYTSSLNNLTYLDLSHNKIDNSSNNLFSNMSKLKFIGLRFNELDAVSPSMFKGLHEITLIDICNSAVSILSNYFFEDFHYLNTINASHNVIRAIEYNSFYETNALEKLDISHNILTSFNVNTSNIVNIQELLLNDNKIENISSESFANLTKLKVINLSHNNFLNINSDIFNNLIDLKTVILSQNKEITSHDLTVSDFNFKQVTNSSIENLDMSSNEIVNINSLAIHFVKKLVDLKLYCNNIAVIDKMTFQELQFLRYLDLHNNGINVIQPGSFLHTGELQDLNLSNNHLSNLEYGTFNGLYNLRHLNLSNNVLLSFTVNLFRNNAPNISTIALDNNIISDIDIENFMNTNVKVLTLGGNPLPCPLLDSHVSKEYLSLSITAEVKDYHSENVRGITCRYQHTKNSIYSKNESISLLTPLLNAIESNAFYTKQLVNINKHTSDLMEEAIKKLNKSTKVNNEIIAFNTNQFLNTNKHIMSDLIEDTIKKLKETTTLNNKTQEHDVSNWNFDDKKTVSFEKEVKETVNGVKTSPLKNNIISQNTNNSKLDGLVYLNLTCVILIIIFLTSVSIYIFYRIKRHQVKSFHDSIHGLSNAMEIN